MTNFQSKMPLSLNRLLALNTASNYVLMGIRILQGILIMRWLYHYLGDDYYGFWSILWAFFSYMIVFNLGFGAASQKYTAEQLFERDIKKYNAVISIIFTSYWAISILISLVVVAASFYIPAWTSLTDPVKISVCRTALLIFGIGTASIFPLAMFSDILAGLRLIYVKNFVLLFIRVAEAAGIYTIMMLDWGFIAIVSYSVGINIVFNGLMYFMVKSRIKGFSLRPSFNVEAFKEIYNFSVFAYVNSIGNLIIAKTDRFVLGAILGLPAVSTYQLGTRVPEISQTLSSQFQDNVVPVSANLIHSGDTGALSKILLSGMRFGAFISVGATVLFYSMTEATIRCLFDAGNDDIFLICKIFLISSFVSCAVRGVPARYLLMSGRHKFVALSTVAEAALNLALSIYWCRQIGLMGVAYGTLVPNIIISCFVLLPPSMKALKYGYGEVFLIFVKPLIAVLPALAICEAAKIYLGDALLDIFTLTAVYAAAGAVYAAISWMFVLTKTERKFISDKLKFLKKVA